MRAHDGFPSASLQYGKGQKIIEIRVGAPVKFARFQRHSTRPIDLSS
jgi:hypothetical protein